MCFVHVMQCSCTDRQTNTHTHTFNGPLSGTTWVSRYQKGNTNLDFTEARDTEWQWHQLGRVQVSTLLQTDNHTNTPPHSFLQTGCPSCRPTNSVKAVKANTHTYYYTSGTEQQWSILTRSRLRSSCSLCDISDWAWTTFRIPPVMNTTRSG